MAVNEDRWVYEWMNELCLVLKHSAWKEANYAWVFVRSFCLWSLLIEVYSAQLLSASVRMNMNKSKIQDCKNNQKGLITKFYL